MKYFDGVKVSVYGHSSPLFPCESHWWLNLYIAAVSKLNMNHFEINAHDLMLLLISDSWYEMDV